LSSISQNQETQKAVNFVDSSKVIESPTYNKELNLILEIPKQADKDVEDKIEIIKKDEKIIESPKALSKFE